MNLRNIKVCSQLISKYSRNIYNRSVSKQLQQNLSSAASCNTIKSNFLKCSSNYYLSTAKFQYDHDRTTVTVLNQENDASLMVDTFSTTGFRLNNGLGVVGSIALFPKSILSWKIKSSEDVNEESLSVFYLLAPKLDLLIFGKGDRWSKYDDKLLPFMRSKGINVEVLPTEQAVTTFNFLNSEGRSVAGAFIPPTVIKYSNDDIADAVERKRNLYDEAHPHISL